MPLNVLYLGNFKHSFCTEVHLARELESLGCVVDRVQEPDNRGDHRRVLSYIRGMCHAPDRPDLVLFTRTWGMPPETTDLWREVEALGVVTASYHLDLYVGLKRGERLEGDPFWTTQHVFTPDGDPKSAEFFAERGINHHWSPPAVVSDECSFGNFDPEFDFDVVFVGSYGYHDEWPWRSQLIDYLNERYGPRFMRFGGDVHGGPIRGQRLNDLYASAKVVVGDSLHLPGHARYFTDRYFETVGRGGFLLAPHVEGIEEFMQTGVHFATYTHPHEKLSVDDALDRVGQRVDWWLDIEDERRTVQRMGHHHVSRHHTYRHRLAKALETMGFCVPPDCPPVEPMVVEPMVVEGTFTIMEEGSLTHSSDWNPEGGMSLRVEGDAAGLITFMEEGALETGIHIDKLELGSGYHPTAGFTHLDINPACPGVDIVGEAWPLNLPDCSVGELRAVDVLEHLSYWDTPKILADWFRVLEPGGKLYVQVPDAEKVMRWFEAAPERLVERLPEGLPKTPLAGATWRLLGGHHDGTYAKGDDDWRFNAHYAFFSTMSLFNALVGVGFTDVKIDHNEHPNLLCAAVKP